MFKPGFGKLQINQSPSRTNPFPPLKHNVIAQMRLTILASCALMSLLLLNASSNRVQAGSLARRQSNGLPDLSDTLAVAKSPYEPVTLPASSPGARNSGPIVAGDGLAESASRIESSLVSTTIERKQSTRAAQSDEQESDTKATSDADSSRSTQSIESTTPAESETETDGLGTANESDIETSTTPRSESSFVTTEAAPVTESTTTAQPTRSADSSESTTTTTTTSPTEETTELTSTTTTTTTTTVGTSSEESEKSLSTDSTAATESSAKDQPELVTNSAEKEQSAAPSAASGITTTTATSFTVTEIPETTTQAPSSTQVPTLETSSTEAPSSVSSPATTEQPTATSSTTPTSDKTKEAKEETSKAVNCNHLPNYDDEEVQKVFREETTYKNGTIRGKFTYINFDQRYRLVHYTRLPYGPVKIDQVEELGKPEQNGTTSGGSTSAEIPNSVLQLRNILPNSLFGFPFLGPSGANKPAEPKESSPVASNSNEAHNNDRSNTYFYSTDSISTPNLLSPSVPVSLLPGQRRLPQPLSHQTPGDTFGQSYYENLPVGNPQDSAETTTARKFKLQTPDRLQAIDEQRQSAFGSSDPNQLRFKYALASQIDSSGHPKQDGLVYNYGTQPQSQYQYSPVPIYAFPQPSYLSSQRQPLISQFYSSFQGGSKLLQSQDQSQDTPPFATYQAHQPHSHEHFVAPFMYAQPVAGSSARQLNRDNLTEPPRPKLKLKTSKTSSIRQEAGSIKSAQLRSSSQTVPYSSPLNSPVQVHKMQHRQRAGKQNHDLKPAYNSSPIVYHVLRSPVGRMYTLPQYHQSHSMAYERDD